MKKKHILPKYKSIKILKTAQCLPFKSVHPDLIDDKRIKKELRRIKKYHLELANDDESYNLELLEIIFSCKFTNLGGNSPYMGLYDLNNRVVEWKLKSDSLKNKATIAHELAHLIQCDYHINSDHLYQPKYLSSLSKVIRFEQQAQAIAFELVKIIYPKSKFTKSHFNAYFNEKDIKWTLTDYFPTRKKCELFKNDLYEWVGKKKAA